LEELDAAKEDIEVLTDVGCCNNLTELNLKRNPLNQESIDICRPLAIMDHT